MPKSETPQMDGLFCIATASYHLRMRALFDTRLLLWALSASVEPAGFNHLPILGAHAAKVVELPPIHKDPFDRLLVAQARVEPMILLTDDDVLGGYGDFVEVV
jgi:hypothetical protein